MKLEGNRQDQTRDGSVPDVCSTGHDVVKPGALGYGSRYRDLENQCIRQIYEHNKDCLAHQKLEGMLVKTAALGPAQVSKPSQLSGGTAQTAGLRLNALQWI